MSKKPAEATPPEKTMTFEEVRAHIRKSKDPKAAEEVTSPPPPPAPPPAGDPPPPAGNPFAQPGTK